MIDLACVKDSLLVLLLTGAVLVGAGCSPADPDPVSAEPGSSERGSSEGGADPAPETPTRTEAVFFIQQQSSGGTVGVFTELESALTDAHSTPTIEHSTRSGEGPECSAKWRYIGRAEGGDRYSVEYSVPRGSSAFETRETTVTYRGERLIVFSDNDWEIGLGPRTTADDEK